MGWSADIYLNLFFSCIHSQFQTRQNLSFVGDEEVHYIQMQLHTYLHVRVFQIQKHAISVL